MLTVKCGRQTYNLTSGDEIVDTGSSREITTQRNGKGWFPVISKHLFKCLVKDGKLELAEGRNIDGIQAKFYTVNKNYW